MYRDTGDKVIQRDRYTGDADRHGETDIQRYRRYRETHGDR